MDADSPRTNMDIVAFSPTTSKSDCFTTALLTAFTITASSLQRQTRTQPRTPDTCKGSPARTSRRRSDTTPANTSRSRRPKCVACAPQCRGGTSRMRRRTCRADGQLCHYRRRQPPLAYHHQSVLPADADCHYLSITCSSTTHSSNSTVLPILRQNSITAASSSFCVQASAPSSN